MEIKALKQDILVMLRLLDTVGENNLIPCWFCTFAHWQKWNDQTIILMVGLFEQWETKQQQKNKQIKKGLYKKL